MRCPCDKSVMSAQADLGGQHRIVLQKQMSTEEDESKDSHEYTAHI